MNTQHEVQAPNVLPLASLNAVRYGAGRHVVIQTAPCRWQLVFGSLVSLSSVVRAKGLRSPYQQGFLQLVQDRYISCTTMTTRTVPFLMMLVLPILGAPVISERCGVSLPRAPHSTTAEPVLQHQCEPEPQIQRSCPRGYEEVETTMKARLDTDATISDVIVYLQDWHNAASVSYGTVCARADLQSDRPGTSMTPAVDTSSGTYRTYSLCVILFQRSRGG